MTCHGSPRRVENQPVPASLLKGKLYRQRHLVNFPPQVCGNLSLKSRERGILFHQIYALGSCQDERMTVVEEKEWPRKRALTLP